MLYIDLDGNTVKSIHSDIESNDNLLINNYFKSVDNILSEISSNIKSTYLIGILNQMKAETNNICDSLKINLENLEDFLRTQMAQYENINAEAADNLKTILAQMDDLVSRYSNIYGSGSTATTDSALFSGVSGKF